MSNVLPECEFELAHRTASEGFLVRKIGAGLLLKEHEGGGLTLDSHE
jgi:hypothetical protein